MNSQTTENVPGPPDRIQTGRDFNPISSQKEQAAEIAATLSSAIWRRNIAGDIPVGSYYKTCEK